MSNKATAKGGMSLGMVLFLIFLILKLTGAITWSWLWVFSPLWLPFALFGLIALVVLILWPKS